MGLYKIHFVTSWRSGSASDSSCTILTDLTFKEDMAAVIIKGCGQYLTTHYYYCYYYYCYIHSGFYWSKR